MSPAARRGTSCSRVASTEAAGTMSQSTRGVSSFATRSGSEVAPPEIAPSFTSASTVSACRAYKRQVWPLRSQRRDMLAPMRPSPTSPSFMAKPSLCVLAPDERLRRARSDRHGGEPAVDRNERPRHEPRRALRCEPDRGSDQLVWLAEPGCRCVPEDCAHAILREEPAVLFGREEAGDDRVDPDVVRRKLSRQVPRDDCLLY